MGFMVYSLLWKQGQFRVIRLMGINPALPIGGLGARVYQGLRFRALGFRVYPSAP